VGFWLASVAVLGLGTTLPARGARAETPSAVFATADVMPSVVIQCGATTASGADWKPDREVTITLDGAQGEALATTVVDSDGTFAAIVQIPCDTSIGFHAIGVFGYEAGSDLQAMEIPIEVVGGSSGTAATGSDVATWLGMTLTLLALGTVTLTTRAARRATPGRLGRDPRRRSRALRRLPRR
jgi:hypothetical protein